MSRSGRRAAPAQERGSARRSADLGALRGARAGVHAARAGPDATGAWARRGRACGSECLLAVQHYIQPLPFLLPRHPQPDKRRGQLQRQERADRASGQACRHGDRLHLQQVQPACRPRPDRPGWPTAGRRRTPRSAASPRSRRPRARRTRPLYPMNDNFGCIAKAGAGVVEVARQGTVGGRAMAAGQGGTFKGRHFTAEVTLWALRCNEPHTVTRPAPPIRPERHVTNSIISVRVAIARTLPRCPCCQHRMSHRGLRLGQHAKTTVYRA